MGPPPLVYIIKHVLKMFFNGLHCRDLVCIDDKHREQTQVNYRYDMFVIAVRYYFQIIPSIGTIIVSCYKQMVP